MTVPRTFHRRQFLGGFGLASLALTGTIPTITAQRSPFATPAAPEATGSAVDGPLGSLLAMAPLSLIPPGVEGTIWGYSDIARQFDSLGMTHSLAGPDFDNEPAVHA